MGLKRGVPETKVRLNYLAMLHSVNPPLPLEGNSSHRSRRAIECAVSEGPQAFGLFAAGLDVLWHALGPNSSTGNGELQSQNPLAHDLDS